MTGRKDRIGRKTVASLQRGDWITDTAIPGFMVRRPRKLALYGLKIRINGRQRFLSIGSEVELTADQARGEAERLRVAKRLGRDPAAERDRRRLAQTIDTVAGRFLATHVRPKLRISTAAHYDEMISRLILPRFGTWRIDAITTSDVSAWHLELTKTPTQANRALAILSSLMQWAVKTKLRDGNPCRGITQFRERTVNRYPTLDDLSRLLMSANALADENKVSQFFAAGLHLLALTGARRSEIFNARWDWCDFSRRVLVLPDSKTGPKEILLPDRAVNILTSLPRISQFVFPSTKTNVPYVNFGPAWAAVLARAAVGRWRMHDLRHGFASAAVAGGAPLFTVGKLLGHARPATTQRYAHLGDDPKRSVAELVARNIENAPGGSR